MELTPVGRTDKRVRACTYNDLDYPAATEGIHPFSDDEAWDVLEDIPNDSAAALVLLEHHWAVPLRDAVARAGGFRIADGFVSPLDLVEIGLVTAKEAEALHANESATVAGAR